MELSIQLPNEVLFAGEVEKITAEAVNGEFCLLPRHIDFVTALAPGLLSATLPGGSEAHFAVDEGILVKQGADVLVSTRTAVRGEEIGELRQLLTRKLNHVSEEEQRARAAIARLETSLARRFVEFQSNA